MKKKKIVVRPEIQLTCKMKFYILHEDINEILAFW